MRRTKIDYLNIDSDSIKITGIENWASEEELAAEFGLGVTNSYQYNGYPYYIRLKPFEHTIYRIAVAPDYHTSFIIGEIISCAEFDMLIKVMKAAGKRLDHIKKTAVNSVKI